MNRKITTLALLLCIAMATLTLGGCQIIDRILGNDERDEHAQLVDQTLVEMRATDETLKSNISDLTGRVTTLEGELETAKNNIGSVSTALTQEIADRKADIKTLQDKDAELQAQITAIETALADKEQGIKDWANGAFVTVAAWNEFKTQINTTIASLTSRIETLEGSVGKINSTLTEMQETDKSLKDSIDGLTTRVTALETELVGVNAKITSLQTDSATKEQLETVKSSLQNQINSLNDEITALKAKDEELQGKITALQNFLTSEIKDVKTWATDTFLSIENWNTAKAKIESDITTLNNKVSDIETLIAAMDSAITALQLQVDKNTQDIEDLTNRINCLEGKHAYDRTQMDYIWSEDWQFCAFSIPCKHCDATWVNSAANISYADFKVTATFDQQDNVEPAVIDISDAREFTADEIKRAVSYMISNSEADRAEVKLTLADDAGSDVFAAIVAGMANANAGSVNLTLSGAETIPEDAFWGCTALGSVTLGEGVKTIGDNAFEKSGLTSITIPKNATSFGEYIFYNCTSLKTVTFDASTEMEAIGDYMFSLCTSLTSVTIPKSVKTIGTSAFVGCEALTSATFEEGTEIENIGIYAFSSCTALESITIPKSVTSIENGAFYCCTALKNVTFESESKLETIGGSAFAFTAITSITIPKSVKTLDYQALALNSSLTTVIFETGTKLETVGNCAFAYCTALTTISFPEGVTSIGNEIFQKCSNLTSVTLPSTLTTIGNAAFWQCTSLESITIPEKVTVIPESMLYECTALKSITFKGVITSVNVTWLAGATPSDITLTLAKGQTVLSYNNGFECEATEEVFVSGTKFAVSTFKEIIVATE